MKGWRFAVKVSYFVISIVIIGVAYLYTDELMVWAIDMMTQAMTSSLGSLGL